MKHVSEAQKKVKYIHEFYFCRISERQKHQGVHRQAIRRKRYGHMAEPPAGISHIALPFPHDESGNLPEKQQCHKRMGQFMSKFHPPFEIVPESRQKHQKENCGCP